MERELVEAGSFCPNQGCELYGQIENNRLVRNGKTPRGVQRFLCRCCRKTFTQTKGTLFYRRSTPDEQILEVLALLAEGMRISSIHRVKGFKEDTILNWLRTAAKHAAEVEACLMQNYQIKQAQIDAMWAYIGHKGEKKAS